MRRRRWRASKGGRSRRPPKQRRGGGKNYRKHSISKGRKSGNSKLSWKSRKTSQNLCQGYGSSFQDRRRMPSEKMEFKDRLTQKEAEIQSYEREVEKYKEKLAASEEQKQKRKLEYRRELEKQEKENTTLRESIHELELDN